MTDELEEIWSLFAEEGKEALDLVEETLLALESDPTHAGQVVKLFRAVHTFKGMARMMGLSVIESLAHRAEDLVALVRDEGVALTGAMIDLLLEVLDHSRVMLDHALTRRCDADAAQVAGLVGRLEAILAEHPGTVPIPQEPPTESMLASVPDDMDDFAGCVEDETPFLVAPVPSADEASAVEGDKASVSGEDVIDPVTDPLYVQIFLDMAGDEMGRLRVALDTLADGEVAAGVQGVRAIADTLMHAAGQMGYAHLVTVLGALVTAVDELEDEPRVVTLNELAHALSEELAALRNGGGAAEMSSECVPLRDGPPDLEGGVAAAGVPGISEAASLFRHWCLDRVCTDLARLGEVMDGLEELVGQFLMSGCALTGEEALAEEAAYLLRAIYQVCTFFRLEPAAHLTLALADLYVRVARGGMTAGESLLNFTRSAIAQLSHVVEAVRAGEAPELARFDAMRGQAEEMLHLHAESRVFQVIQAVLGGLDMPSHGCLPSAFIEVMTRENLLAVGRALQDGKILYTVLADLNQAEMVGQAFYEWSRSDGVSLITSVTVYQDDRTLFNFLLATAEPQDAILETFAGMDPQGHYLSLEACVLREGASLNKSRDKDETVEDTAGIHTVRDTVRRTQRAGASADGDWQRVRRETIGGFISASTEAPTGLVKDVGELVATRATLHRVVQRLAELDVLENVPRLVKRADGDWQRVREELERSLESWTGELHTLSQVDAEMGVALDRFQEQALALRARPAAEILAPLQRLVQDMARHQGKLVKLEVAGADVELDVGALDVLSDPVRRLVWFAVTHSIENPVQRQEAGKPAVGCVSIRMRKTANHVRVVIEDDGRGVDPQAVRDRGDVEANDLSAISATLQAHRGRLSVVGEPGEGTRFSLELPLDTVVIDGMVVRAGGVHYVVPVGAIQRIVKPEKRQVVRSSADGNRSVLQLGEELVPIQTLVGDTVSHVPNDGLLLVIEGGKRGAALVVDELIGQQQVLIQPLQGYMADVPGVSGYALLGEGDVGMVLDLSQVGDWLGPGATAYT